MGEYLGLAAADGHRLAARRFAPTSTPWATMVIAPAMAVRQDFYAPIAQFFADHGVHVLTFDYRGMGASRHGDLAKLDVDVMDWAQKDLDAMLLEAANAAPALPLLFLGHSLGGQLLGALPHREKVAAAVVVTAGSGWYRFNDRMKWSVRALWFVVMPLLTPLFGYFPGKRLRVIGDLPKGVARQWRRWCLHPDYLLSQGDEIRARFATLAKPMLSFSFEDDPMITRAAVKSLNGFYRAARLEHRHVVPEPGKAIAHFGFFHASRRETLWSDSLAWLRAMAKAA